MKKTVAILVASMFLVYSGVCSAGSPKGLQKKDKTPKGFSQGQKTGWDGEYPNGWDNFSEKEKDEWVLKHDPESKDEGKSKKNKKEKHKKKKDKKK